MVLVPRDHNTLLLATAGSVSQRRLRRGLKLNVTEAHNLLAWVANELIRDGILSYQDSCRAVRLTLGENDVLEGVSNMIKEVHVEAMFPDGGKMLSVSYPICRQHGHRNLSLYGLEGSSTITVSELEKLENSEGDDAVEICTTPPGCVKSSDEDIIFYRGLRLMKLDVTNEGDRGVAVGSHFPFHKVNNCLKFDRHMAGELHLRVLPGTLTRFEPGVKRSVELVPFSVTTERVEEEGLRVDSVITRLQLGPLAGDKIRLADSKLWLTVDHDRRGEHGDEVLFGGGKTCRSGINQAPCGVGNAVDLVITGGVIFCPIQGCFKADLGVLNGRIVSIGQAGNPLRAIRTDIVIGPETEVIAAEGLILTPGVVDAHVHFITPEIVEEALAGGTTTLLGGGTGLATGTRATTCTPGANHIRQMIRSTLSCPINVAFTGKGSVHSHGDNVTSLEEMITAGAVGLKVHEDWGADQESLDVALTVGERLGVVTTIHTDSCNEGGACEDTLATIGERSAHMYHVEGAGGGHTPDIIRCVGLGNVLPSSTNPTLPLTTNTMAEAVDMLISCHHLNKDNIEDLAFAQVRLKPTTIAAEGILHDIGAISMITSDSLAMGRISEVSQRCWQLADAMIDCVPDELRHLVPQDERLLRYLAKITINPAIAHGVAEHVGSLDIGKLADIVFWTPQTFGVKPCLVMKSGQIVLGSIGPAFAAVPDCSPIRLARNWGWQNASHNSVTFVSRQFIAARGDSEYNTRRIFLPISKNVEKIKKCDMIYNDQIPILRVCPDSFRVYLKGIGSLNKPNRFFTEEDGILSLTSDKETDTELFLNHEPRKSVPFCRFFY